MKEFRMKQLIIGTHLFFFIMVTCVILIATGKVTLSIHGFAVDSQERLYVGVSKHICVYENGKPVKELDSFASDNYSFKITEDDRIVLATLSTVYTMDLDGNVLSEVNDRNLANSTQSEIKRNSKPYISPGGNAYRKKGLIGRTRIVKNDTQIVYKISVLSVIVKYVMILTFVGFWLFIECEAAIHVIRYFRESPPKKIRILPDN